MMWRYAMTKKQKSAKQIKKKLCRMKRRYAMGEKTKVLPEHSLTNLTTNKTTYILSNE